MSEGVWEYFPFLYNFSSFFIVFLTSNTVVYLIGIVSLGSLSIYTSKLFFGSFGLYKNYFLPPFCFFVLQYLYGAQELRIEYPFIFCVKHLFFENLLGNLNVFPSFRLHFLFFFVELQQFVIYTLCY